MPLRIEIITPEGELVDVDDATHVLLPGADGEVGILPGHSPMACAMQIGVIHVDREEGQTEVLASHGGFAEINSDHIMVLAESAEKAEEIDKARAEKALKQARQKLRHATEQERGHLEAAVARAHTRLRAARMAR